MVHIGINTSFKEDLDLDLRSDLPKKMLAYELKSESFLNLSEDLYKFVTKESLEESTLSLSFSIWETVVFGATDVSELAVSGIVKVSDATNLQLVLNTMLTVFKSFGIN